jgi:hypothetical protein|tara:strand:- start:924 stop:1523 length:600 start_codon:yes stop_codon:yes gene_type:complete
MTSKVDYVNADAWTLHNEAAKMVAVNRVSSVAIGMLIHYISERKLYKELGFDTLDEYMAAPYDSCGLDLSPRTGYRYESIARKFVIELGIEEGIVSVLSPTKLDVLAPHTTNDNLEQVLADVAVLSTSSIRQNLSEGIYGNEKTDMKPMVLSIRKELLDEYRNLVKNTMELLWPSDDTNREKIEDSMDRCVRRIHELEN